MSSLRCGFLRHLFQAQGHRLGSWRLCAAEQKLLFAVVWPQGCLDTLRFIKFGQLPPRKMITVDCGMNGLLSGFHFEFSEGGRWARSKYTCSKARIFAENRVKYGNMIYPPTPLPIL